MSTYIHPASLDLGISDDFDDHVRRHSVNPGTDYRLRFGSPVVAIADGKVAFVDNVPDGSGGRMVGINHATGAYTESLHLSSISVKKGQAVKQGDEIGKSGASANGKEYGVGTHLHLTFRPLGVKSPNADFEVWAKAGQVDGGTVVPSSPAGSWVGIQKMLAKLYGYEGDIDNVAGKGTIAAFQRFLAKVWGYAGPIDGVASKGGNTWKAAQRWLRDRYGYRGTIDGIPGAGTMAALARASEANASAF